METSGLQDGGIERRYSEIRAEGGRRLSGVVIRYGEVSTGLPWRERFERGAFGDVGALDVRLTVQHVRSRLIARTGGGGLELTDGQDALRMTADLPESREADDTLSLVRNNVLRGLSVEFQPLLVGQDAGVRVVRRAGLPGLSVVDKGAYSGSVVAVRAELRQDGEGLAGSFHYNVNRVVSDRAAEEAGIEERQRGRRKTRVAPGAFRNTLQDPSREVVVTLGRTYNQPLGSKLASAGSSPASRLTLVDGPDSLDFEIDRLPATTYVDDFRATHSAGAAQYGIDALYFIPPPDVVPDAVSLVAEAAEEGGALVEVVRQANLTSLAVVSRAPRGNPGVVQMRRRRWW